MDRIVDKLIELFECTLKYTVVTVTEYKAVVKTGLWCKYRSMSAIQMTGTLPVHIIHRHKIYTFASLCVYLLDVKEQKAFWYNQTVISLIKDTGDISLSSFDVFVLLRTTYEDFGKSHKKNVCYSAEKQTRIQMKNYNVGALITIIGQTET